MEEEKKEIQENAESSEKTPEVPEAQETSSDKTTTGLKPGVGGLLCYLLGFITGIIFIVIEKDNKFIRFHAIQSIATFGFLFICGIVLGSIPGLGLLLAPIVTIGSFILWIILMVKAYNGEKFKLPVVGDIAENNS